MNKLELLEVITLVALGYVGGGLGTLLQLKVWGII